MKMTSSRPYLLRAIYQWLVDNRLTPYLMVDTTHAQVRVPERFIEDNQIILNVAEDAVRDLQLGNELIEFMAQFSGVVHQIVIPVKSVKAIYAFENGRGMVFNAEDEDEEGGREGEEVAEPAMHSENDDDQPTLPPTNKGGKKPPWLKIIK